MKHWRDVSGHARLWAEEGAVSEFISPDARTALNVAIILLADYVFDGTLPKPRLYQDSDYQIRITSHRKNREFGLRLDCDEQGDWSIECYVGGKGLFESSTATNFQQIRSIVDTAATTFTNGIS